MQISRDTLSFPPAAFAPPQFPRREVVGVPYTTRDGALAVAAVTVREMTVADWPECGAAFGRLADALLGSSVTLALASARGSVYEAAGALVGDAAVCLRRCVEWPVETASRPGSPRSLDDLPLDATAPLVEAFLRLNLLDAKKATALASVAETLGPTLRRQVERIEAEIARMTTASPAPSPTSPDWDGRSTTSDGCPSPDSPQSAEPPSASAGWPAPPLSPTSEPPSTPTRQPASDTSADSSTTDAPEASQETA